MTAPAELRVGIIGFDTSHTIAFTKLLNTPDAPFHVAGARVVAGCPTFSPDVHASASRVDDFSRQMGEMGVAFVGSVDDLASQVDAVILASVDGRRHLAEALPVLRARKPLFIDKPLAHCYAEAAEIVRVAVQYDCPLFSASSLRFDANIAPLWQDATAPLTGCEAFSPATLEATNPGLFWYGVHGAEILYALMGIGCRAVRCTSTPACDLVVGTWQGERVGTLRGLRNGSHPYGVTVFDETGVHHVQRSSQVPLYHGLLQEIVSFFQTGQAPIPIEETLEIMAFMQAALWSQQQNREVVLNEVTDFASAP